MDSSAEVPVAAEAARVRKHPPLLWIVLAAALIGGIAWGARWWTFGRFQESTDNAFVQADLVVISPKVAGYVSDVMIGDNRQVAAGQPLVGIDPVSYDAALDQARAELAQRQADVDRDTAEIRQQQATRNEAAAHVTVAAAAMQLASAEAGRFTRLAASGADTTERRDQAVSASAQATGQLAAARAAAETASRQIDTLQAQLAQGRAAIATAQAHMRSAANDLAGTRIVSPIAGRVSDRSVRRGQFVQPGTRLMTIVPETELYLIANFKETQIGRMRPGQPVSIHIDALPDNDIAGTIDSLAPGTGAQFALIPPENATGNFTKIVQRVPVRIRLKLDPALRAIVRPGLSAEVSVDIRNPGSGA